MREWTFLHSHIDMPYVDYHFHRHFYHEVTITYDADEDRWYGSTRLSPVSEGPTGGFDMQRDLPDAITQKLIKLLELNR